MPILVDVLYDDLVVYDDDVTVFDGKRPEDDVPGLVTGFPIRMPKRQELAALRRQREEDGLLFGVLLRKFLV